MEVVANVNRAGDAAVAVEAGAEGIGLFRTEFLYIDRSTPPTEDEQFAIYRETILAMNGKPVVLRTFDIGGDMVFQLLLGPHKSAVPVIRDYIADAEKELEAKGL